MRTDSLREAAAELLLTQRLYSLFLDITRLRCDRPIFFRAYGDFCRETKMTLDQLKAHADLRDGCTLRWTREGVGVYIILYNESQKNVRRRNFTLAHELGHIYLDHMDDSAENETEANEFASELLMPSVLVRELARRTRRPLTPADLCEIFAVSNQAARFRLGKLDNKGNNTDNDFRILRQLGPLLPNIDGPVVNL